MDLSGLPHDPHLPDPEDIKFEPLLPSEDDYVAIKKNFAVLTARVLKEYMSFFGQHRARVPRHITHDHYEQMQQRSEVVSLICVYFMPSLGPRFIVSTANLVTTCDRCKA